MPLDTNPEVLRTLTSPSFFIPYPRVIHHDRIPPDVLGAMQPTWRRRWFAPRPVTLTIHENVIVVGEGLVFTQDLDVLPTSVGQHWPHHIEQARAAIVAARGSDRIPRLSGTTVLCKKSGAYHYGHWLMELLPRACLARRYGPEAARFMILEVQPPLRPIIRQSLACLGIGPKDIVETGPEPVTVDRLLMVDGLSEHGYFMSPLVMRCLDDATRHIPPAGKPKLFVTRPRGAGRCLVDQERVERAAADAGYAVLDPAGLPFTAQVARFKAARRVVGVMGSALAGVAFARPGATVVNIAPANMPDNFFWFISGLRQHDYTEIRCEPVARTAPREHAQTTILDEDIALAPGDLELALSGPAGAGGSHDPDGLALERDLRPLFDPDYYRERYPESVPGGLDPYEHYDRHGWRAGLDPSPLFSTQRYLAFYGDVAGAGVNPLMHYIQYGHAEGRRAFPVEG